MTTLMGKLTEAKVKKAALIFWRIAKQGGYVQTKSIYTFHVVCDERLKR
jgi:hypothetical protein